MQSGRRGGSGAHSNSSIQKHLQSMFYLLRPEETLKMAVKLESVHPNRTRYLVVVSRMGSRGEESCLLGIDCNEKTTVGLILRVLANTKITLDGDGGFSVSVCERHHIFKPVSVQAMWSALQTLHKVSAKARQENYFSGGGSHAWTEHYESRIESDRSCLNEWHAMDNLESKRPPSPDSIRTKPTEREETEKVIRSTLKEIMMSVDLDEVTSKAIRSRLEEELDMDLGEYKSFIDQEMLVILGQMDAPTEIFDHVYLGSEWNASNYEELQRNGVGHILNVTREIDNFFPGTFDYLNVRVYDDEKTDLLKYWDDTFKYITKAKNNGSKVLVHCKMGVSRSASVVIAYAMKAYNWDFHRALRHVKDKRSCIKPNVSFVSQLETYQGILDAMKNKEKLQRSKSETNLNSVVPTVAGKTEKTTGSGQQTPAAQVLSKSYDLQATMSGQDLRGMGARPKSWSPEDAASREVRDGMKSSPVFMSLEELSQKSASKESVKSIQNAPDGKSRLARHVLLPCDNGESYSVSPNQIVHLPGHDSVTTSCRHEEKKIVLNLASRFENADLDASDDSSCSNLISVDAISLQPEKETWDPGEQDVPIQPPCTSSSADCDPNPSSCSVSECRTTVWTSTAVVKTQSAVPPSSVVPESRVRCDPFSNQLDRVFDKEEKKQQRVSSSPTEGVKDDKGQARECPSRQSSWSSYDSAVAMGFPENAELSRHSSWGSGDTRNLPSRNSSWGSYDMRPRGQVYYNNEKGEKILHGNSEMLETSSSGIFPYEKEDIPWHPGTVKRSKQRIEGGSVRKCGESLTKTPSAETLLFDFDPTRPVEAINDALVDSAKTTVETESSAISQKINIPEQDVKRVNMSFSAPERSSMELVSQEHSLSRSTSNMSNYEKANACSGNVVNTAQCSSVKQHRTFLENLHRETQQSAKKLEETFDGGSLGKVKNLKKEFEAKSATIENGESDAPKTTKSGVNSLPSSPVSVHQSKESKSSSGDDLNLKSLIGIFENKDESQVKLRQKNTPKPFSHRNGRHSCIEVSVVEKSPPPVRHTSHTPLISNLNRHSSVVEKHASGECKRPPMVPVVRNSSPGVLNSSPSLIAATVIATAAKKQQQYGKSHPLARLNIKPRHNNPVYNTM